MNYVDRDYIDACEKAIAECQRNIQMYQEIMEDRSWEDNVDCRKKIQEEEARIRSQELEIKWCIENQS